MGHTWREMDPSGAEAQDRRMERLLKLRKDLEETPLTEFTAGADFKALYRVNWCNIHNQESLEDMDRLEKRVVEYKAKQMSDKLPPLL